MKPEMITVKAGDITLCAPAQLVIGALLATAMGNSEAPAISLPAPLVQAPAIGEYWPGQGGHNAGLVAARDGVPAHYLIVAAEDVGKHKWGRYGEDSKATSKLDGAANTAALIVEGDHPAAIEATKYEADDHSDFYLPAAGELYHCWLNVAELFRTDTWYWSSSQRSANLAFLMHFDDGIQYSHGKDNELRVRPVRRFFI